MTLTTEQAVEVLELLNAEFGRAAALLGVHHDQNPYFAFRREGKLSDSEYDRLTKLAYRWESGYAGVRVEDRGKLQRVNALLPGQK